MRCASAVFNLQRKARVGNQYRKFGESADSDRADRFKSSGTECWSASKAAIESEILKPRHL